MSWTYKQSNGSLYDSANVRVAIGYSGRDEGKNNPAMQHVPNVGPIPQGDWIVCGPPRDTPQHGPFTLRLVAENTTNTHGRSGFLIHGDSLKAPGTASEGCIILPRGIRERIWKSNDLELRVVP